ncbi:MAG: hypothetical protein PVJ36_03685 [Nitrospirota bacterium]|jgi:hypothetical protein
MTELALDKLRPEVSEKVRPFFEEVLVGYRENIHSIHVTGSSLTDDFDPKASNINSIIVLGEMDLRFLELLAPRGKKYRKQNVSAPLIMTPKYISASLDVFPVEFLNFKLLHETVYGEDILEGLEIRHRDLRQQCERDLKSKLIALRQGYLSSMGDAKAIAEGLVDAITAHMPLFRGIIAVSGKTPPTAWNQVLDELGRVTSVDCGVYRQVLDEKRKREKLPLTRLNTLFEEYYAATEKLKKVIDEIQV